MGYTILGYTILYVEDDQGVRESVAEILASAGFRVLVAKDGYEAVRLLAENEVDVLLTDIVMPGRSGLDLARQARQLRAEIKIIFMTAYYSRAGEAAALGGLLFKPVRGQEMIDGLTRLLAS